MIHCAQARWLRECGLRMLERYALDWWEFKGEFYQRYFGPRYDLRGQRTR